MDMLNYKGDVGLSCDDFNSRKDTAQHMTLKESVTFSWATQASLTSLLIQKHFNESLKAKSSRKQARIPTIIVAALAIPDNLDAEQLFQFNWKTLNGLLQRRIKVSSYASDGSNVERSVQDMLERHADRTTELRIKHPADDNLAHEDLVVPILWFKNQPLAIIQDTKRLLKTRTIPNLPVLFADVRAMAFSNSPTFLRDVEKVDRRDGNAAA
ncbi:LOW QUALITY PROTEIN: hypothetical protein CVT26_007545 [Gymnopilus dilepis]|uniref:Uncharacterized protein n=1 Tax=Gymnopilus dilepis TaxID=231916 RepID=A0A409WZ20_9AGAR|nr:LOW QUALITY PROTEIN: hypothetical protein CVT26_007545 [Gymnopilus dilepis]